MSHTPNDSAIKVDAALNEKLKTASHEEMKELLKDAGTEQGLWHPDWDTSILVPNEPSAAPQKVGKVVRLNGVAYSLTADDEAGLLAQETEIYKQAMKPAATTQQIQQPRDETTGRFVEQKQPVAAVDAEKQAALSVQFQLGQISASDYLEQSGAIDSYLEKAGIPLEDLKAQVQEKQGERLTSSWQSATDEFLAGSGNWWPGGARHECE